MGKTTIKQQILVPNTQARIDAYRYGSKTDKMRWITVEIVGSYSYDGGSYWEPSHSEYDIEAVFEIVKGRKIVLPDEDDEWLEYWMDDINEKAEEQYFKDMGY